MERSSNQNRAKDSKFSTTAMSQLWAIYTETAGSGLIVDTRVVFIQQLNKMTIILSISKRRIKACFKDKNQLEYWELY